MNMLGPAPSLEEALYLQVLDAAWEAQVATCRKKRAFRSKASAKSYLIEKQSRGENPPDLVPYHCSVCRKFHLTSKD